MKSKQFADLLRKTETKIVLLVLDGLGGLPQKDTGKTELEKARTPNLDKLASAAITGLHEPVEPGITPGSGPSHLALFGYDPLRFQVGRGVLSALGIDFDLLQQDVAARGNFCTVDDSGRVKDRRAGRINTDKNQKLCKLLSEIKISNAEVLVQTVKEHRFLLIIRGENLPGEISDTDPQEIGAMPLEPEALTPQAEKTVPVIKEFIAKADEKLKGQEPANMVLLRGFSKRPSWPTMSERFGLTPAAIAGYPMYRGVGKLVGMEALTTGEKIEQEFDVLKSAWNSYDFFYVHVKKSDSAGEDGDFERKVEIIEHVDQQLPSILENQPEVLIVTGDHSTPSTMKAHSWHPVPVLMWATDCRPDAVNEFSEKACVSGGLGPRFETHKLMQLALGHAGKLEKFGA